MQKENYLLHQIDELKEKARQLQTLLTSKEDKVTELETIVSEKKEQATELDNMIESRKEAADRLIVGVSVQIQEMIQDLKNMGK